MATKRIRQLATPLFAVFVLLSLLLVHPLLLVPYAAAAAVNRQGFEQPQVLSEGFSAR